MQLLVVLIALVGLSVSKPVKDVTSGKNKEMVVELPNYTEDKAELDFRTIEDIGRASSQPWDVPGAHIILVLLIDADKNVLNYEKLPADKVSAVSVTEQTEFTPQPATHLALEDTPEVLEAKAQHVAAHTIALARLAQEYQKNRSY